MHQRYRKQLVAWEEDLRSAARRTLLEKAGWAKDMPVDAGVYVIWHRASGDPLYVGQTACLLARMSDVGRPINHTFRRRVEQRLGLATNQDLALACTMSFMAIPLGRSELEEYLRIRWAKTIVNGAAKRLRVGPQYDWVKPIALS